MIGSLSPNRKLSKVQLLATTFIAGLVSLALEIAAARLLAPAFGTTELIWAGVIGLILLYFSAGYALGGRWADRDPRPATLYTALSVAGLTIAAIPIASRPLLVVAARGMQALSIGSIVGPFVVILLLFAAPVTLLACVSPFAVRLAVDDVASSGGAIGRFSATATLGSFIGTFMPNLVLIPNLGTRRTFLLLALVALSTGLWGLWRTQRRRFWGLAWTLLAVGAVFVWEPAQVKPQANLIFETESTYNLIQVIESDDHRRYLLLNEGQGIHSIYTPPELYGDAHDPLALLTGGPWDYYLVAPFFNAPQSSDASPVSRVKDLLVVGLAAGTTPTQFTEVYGPLPIDGVEIDPAIVQAGRDYFGMTMPNLTVHIADGRTYLLQTDARYSVIAIDAYRLPYIPWHLTTVEFFRDVRDHLREDGVVAINVGHTPEAAGGPAQQAKGDWRLVDAMVNTMRSVYPSVHVIAVPGSFNAIVIGTVQVTSPANLAANAPSLNDPRLRAVAQRALGALRTPEHSSVTFTDDRAPVEQLTHALALRYVLGID
ncbi:MAG: fused MFS/spermidine synthase [Anaerolineae bacterium]|nr:fused MFS/spermidine synthase [Anaerolineae bacterium]